MLNCTLASSLWQVVEDFVIVLLILMIAKEIFLV